MFCDACGARLEQGASFCASCGKALRTAPLMPPAQGRIAGHVRLLGILWLAMSAFHLIPALVMFAMFGRGLGFMPPGVPEGFKSVAVEAVVQPRDKTLTDAEIDALSAKIVAAAAKATGAKLRN